MAGWIKLHRKLINSAVFDNEKMLKVWVWCLFKATHKEYEQLIGRQVITLSKGQFITGRNAASTELNMTPSTAWDYLKLLEKNESINIKSNNKYSVVTIVNWELYQAQDEISDSKSDSNSDNKSTTNQQQINTNKNVKNIKNNKNIKNKDIYSPTIEIIDYLNMKCGTNYKATSQKTKDLIKARINEGYILKDFIKVIDNKTEEWLYDDKMSKFLRPETLFSNKFEGYLNQKVITSNQYKSSNPFVQMMQDELEKEGFINAKE